MTITSRVKGELFETNEFRPIRIATSIAPPSTGFDDDLPAIHSRGSPWSQEEHEKFLDALAQFPYGPWRVIADHIGTRTARQAMSHAQKYRQKITRRKRDAAKHNVANVVQRAERHLKEPSEAAAVEQQVPVPTAKPAVDPVGPPAATRYELPSLSMQAYVDASELPFGAFYAGASSGYYDNYAQFPPTGSAMQAPPPTHVLVTSAVGLAEMNVHMQDWHAYLPASAQQHILSGAWQSECCNDWRQ